MTKNDNTVSKASYQSKASFQSARAFSLIN